MSISLCRHVDVRMQKFDMCYKVTPQLLLSSHSSFLIFLVFLNKMRGKVQQGCRQLFPGDVSLMLFIEISLCRHVDVRMHKFTCAMRSLLNFVSGHTNLSLFAMVVVEGAEKSPERMPTIVSW